MGERLAEKLQQLQCQLTLDATASTLEVADQQMVEILRGLMRNAKILILDEPTASLTPGETERLFRQIRALQALGVGIVLSRTITGDPPAGEPRLGNARRRDRAQR